MTTEYVREAPPHDVEWKRSATGTCLWTATVLGVEIEIEKSGERQLTARLMYMGEPYASSMEWGSGQPDHAISAGLETLKKSAALSVWYLKHWWSVDPKVLAKRMRAKPYWPAGTLTPPARDMEHWNDQETAGPARYGNT